MDAGLSDGLLGLLSQNTTGWVASRQQTLSCHRSAGWKSEIRMLAWSSSGEVCLLG